ncbi:single-stranded DNA-binding protein [Paenimyroides tangerinum]|uniref:Single-stranded DNA-binding protein n=1 Tax=Paenimyroides tangerinum TaxID=2488728 RepID=A0A3P3W5Y5_9FLAO|nr:single-stranded DNA-binding protein [Paenimyroides tangerinum]RRJ90565.1 single-stranded DNA-binding protein [Paenimyroides tangerinum]
MSTLRNSVRLIGRVGNNPEVKNFDGGKKVATLTLATNEVYYNDKNEKVENTQWHNLVAWGKVAEIIEKFIEKGKEIAVEGKLTYRTYDDKEGNKRYVTEIVINEIVLF